jgi:DNA polymerase elongation subunit (family B)
MALPVINDEIINKFLEGRDPQTNIVAIECSYQDSQVTVISKVKDQKVRQLFDFKPFVWAKKISISQLYNGDKNKISQAMMKYHIGTKWLNIYDKDHKTNDRLENGYRILFYAKQKMSYNYFLKFFKEGGIDDIYNDPNKGFLSLSPVEQFFIMSGKRQFKGCEDYDDLSRTLFDLETQGLNPEKHRITQIGIRTNRKFEHIIRVENNDKSEIDSIIEFLDIINKLDPDVIAGHNSENFDWPFIITRCEMLGINFKQLTEDIFGHSIYKKTRKTVLKLGGEIEYFNKTVFPFHIILDSLHAVRRAQAIDSNMRSGSLKYVTKYAKLNKPNRIYIVGDQLNILWNDDINNYALNNDNGDWYKIDINNPLKEGYESFNSKYIVERYLKDDLYETDKVELTYNQQNFLLSKILPIPFEKVCTMGIASIWKSLMLAWSYENDLAIPAIGKTGSFTGGLSRLLKVGFVDNVLKLDFSSLYPSITLTWNITPDSDISGVMLNFLNHILTQREKYKGLMKQAAKQCDAIKLQMEHIEKESNEYKILEEELKKYEIEEHANDKKQLPFKIFGNAFFGSFGSGNIFNWSDLSAAENITCVGRQSLRLMIKWFSDRGYNPIVGDSFLYDTPVYVKYDNTGYIDILPICNIFNENNIQIDTFGREYDISEKPYKILCRSGWVYPKYVYRHKTNKKIRRIKTKTVEIDVTEDHSLYNSKKEKIHSKDSIIGTSLEIYNGDYLKFGNNSEGFDADWFNLNEKTAWLMGLFLANGSSVYSHRYRKYYSKKDKSIHYYNTHTSSFTINKLNKDKLLKANEILSHEFFVESEIKVYKIKTGNRKLSKFFNEHFYTNDRYNKTGTREKKVPIFILNAAKNIQKSFLDGFYFGDNKEGNIYTATYFYQKSKVAISGILLLCENLGITYAIGNDLQSKQSLKIKLNENIEKSHTKTNEFYKTLNSDVIWYNEFHNNYDIENYVYDISLDGTVVNALGNNIAAQTDGFNFKAPALFKYTKDNPYISNGNNRNTKDNAPYIGAEGDVAEFNDLFMRGKMGLSLENFSEATINFSRKNYADLLINNKTGEYEIKLIGNSIKSKKMPLYIENFINEGISLLLHNNGYNFLKNYYDYIEKIYNGNITLKEIASKGKIKKTIKEYKADCQNVNISGNKKARQAWYELCIKNNINPDLGSTIYYINIGENKGDGDVKREKIYQTDEEGKFVKVDMMKDGMAVLTKTGKVKQEKVVIGEEIILNCIMIPTELIENDSDLSEISSNEFNNIEYNTAKYIEQFNKKIRPLLVCFSTEIRDQILISNPKEVKYFTENEAKLISGEPYKIEDQDTYEQLMTMENKELKFWNNNNKIPPFLEEIGMDWNKMVNDYNILTELQKSENIRLEIDKFNNIIDKLTKDDIDDIIETAILPSPITNFLKLDNSLNLISKEYDVQIGTIYDIIDKIFIDNNMEDGIITDNMS